MLDAVLGVALEMALIPSIIVEKMKNDYSCYKRNAEEIDAISSMSRAID